MKLYGAIQSPYVRKVSLVARHVGVWETIQFMEADRSDPSLGICRVNPLGKIPALELDDGTVLFDSPVIADYLVSLTENTLYPAGGLDLWKAKTVHALADGVMDFSFALVKSRLLPEGERSPSFETRQENGVRGGLAALNEIAETLDPDTMASIAAGCAVGYVEFRTVVPGWQTDNPALTTWWDDVKTRPDFAATTPTD